MTTRTQSKNVYILNILDFTKEYRAPVYVHGHRWGNWHLDAQSLALNYLVDGHFVYGVDIERISSAWDVLDWICQVGGKRLPLTTADEMHAATGHLVAALNDLFVPQHQLRDGRKCKVTRKMTDAVYVVEVQYERA